MRIAELLKIIFPDSIYCFSCNSIIDSSSLYGLCDSCMEKFNFANKKTCEKCGKILWEDGFSGRCKDCRNQDHDFDKGYTCLMYGLMERKVLKRFKYCGESYMKDKLSVLLYDRLKIELNKGLIIDYLTCVPIHRRKKAERGYNQAELLAKGLSRLTGIEMLSRILVREKYTVPMSGLSKEMRKTNLKEAFSVNKDWKTMIEGKNILIVDDVYTTGATLDACAGLLKEEGASSVYVLTLMAGRSN